MDAVENEGDIRLQKAASGLLGDFDSSLKPFLWRTVGGGKLQIRQRVRVKEKDRLIRLVCLLSARPLGALKAEADVLFFIACAIPRVAPIA